MHLIAYLKQNLVTFRKSERILADWILQNPQKTTKLTIKGLSFLTHISEPSIVRFCRAVGTKGYADFKLKLTENLASGQTNSHLDLAAPIASGALRNHVIDLARQALTECKLELSDEALEYAIYQLNTAPSLIIAALGSFESDALSLYAALWSKISRVAVIKEPEQLHLLKFPESLVGKKPAQHPWLFLIDDGSVLAHKTALLAMELGYKLFVVGLLGSPFEKTAEIAWCFSKSDEAFSHPLNFQLKVKAALEMIKHGLNLESQGKLQKRLIPSKTKLAGVSASLLTPDLGRQTELW